LQSLDPKIEVPDGVVFSDGLLDRAFVRADHAAFVHPLKNLAASHSHGLIGAKAEHRLGSRVPGCDLARPVDRESAVGRVIDQVPYLSKTHLNKPIKKMICSDYCSERPKKQS
jgi:hypothetical protein